MKKKYLVIGGAVILVAALVIPRFIFKEKEEASIPPMVSVQNPAIGDVEVFTGLTGTIEPADMVYVISKAGGEVTGVHVQAGDYVEEGQLLVNIDTKQVDGAKIQLETARINMNDAQKNLERMAVLFQSGDISAQAYEQVQSGAKMAKLQYEGAKLAYDLQMDSAEVKATISGLVESFNVDVHDNVGAGTVLAVISGEGSKAIAFNVTERIVGNLHVGDEIKVEKNGLEYKGTITEVSSMVDAMTGLFKIKASLDKADALPTGAMVKLYVTSEESHKVLTIPTDAIYYQAGESYVYTLVDGVVHETPVEIGVYNSETTEILSGVTAADDVIVTWSNELYEGSEVEIYGAEQAETAEAESESAAQ